MPIVFNGVPKSAFFPKRNALKNAIKNIANKHGFSIGELTYIFVTDGGLLDMNQTYLNHDYFTDIITFDNSETEKKIEGDVFISWERVEENGRTIGDGILEEYVRVIGHGFLHLLGYLDKKPNEKEEMRRMESAFIEEYNSITK